MIGEPWGAPGTDDDDDTWQCVATHGQSEHEVKAALMKASAQIRAEQIRGLRAQGVPERVLTQIAQVGERVQAEQIDRDLPNIMRTMKATDPLAPRLH